MLCYALLSAAAALSASAQIDLGSAVVAAPADADPIVRNAAEMISDEIEARSYIRLAIADAAPAEGSVIAVGTKDALAKIAPAYADAISALAPEGDEGYAIATVADGANAAIFVTGNTSRGVIFGAGRLLRELTMTKRSVVLDEAFDETSAPAIPMRGHQAGYRPKVNTYDGWTPREWKQYIRDMVVFGTNAFEMMPPNTDDAADSPHFTRLQIDMLPIMSELAHNHGMDVWLWYPAMAEDYGDTATVNKELAEWGAVFEKIPYIDDILVPGGDPGHTKPVHLMNLLEKQTAVLHKTHPNARMWVSPQGFTADWMDEWLELLKPEPEWLHGVVFAPQNRLSLADMRALVPARYPIRHYPDITHSYSCQYPVQDWDVAYQLTQHREVINPRPEFLTKVFHWSMDDTVGFVTYSEGVNDDYNKILWSLLGWDPEMDIAEITRQYARYYIGPEYEDEVAKLLFALEDNWEGPLLANAGVVTTYLQARDLHKAVSPQTLLNWRFQMVLYRAYFDAFVRRRLVYETDLEEQALEILAKAPAIGAAAAMDEAERVLRLAVFDPVGAEIRTRVSDMAEALYQSIQMQHSVERFHAIDAGRGGNFDYIDRALNNRPWMEARFAEIRALEDEKERLAAVDRIVNWTNPGPGGFYDDLGNISQQPNLVRNVADEFDPENRVNPLMGYYPWPADRRVSWYNDAETRFEAPLHMRYTNLDPNAEYTLRAVYAGDKWDTQMSCMADESIEIHPLIDKPDPIAPLEFDIPKEATADGELLLTWNQTPGRGSAGRGTQIAEVWLIKKK